VPSDRERLNLTKGDLEELVAIAAQAERPSEIVSAEIKIGSIGNTPNEVLAVWTSQAIEFCKQHGIAKHVESAVNVAQKMFSSLQGLEIRLQEDPDFGETSIAVQVTCQASATGFLSEYRRCMQEWDRVIPAESLSLMGLTYRLL
jgi:hypothetical protein